MMINGFRLRFGFDSEERAVTIRVDREGTVASYGGPVQATEGVGVRVSEAIDAMVSAGVVPPDYRNLVLGIARQTYEDFGHLWECLQ
jgi:hypothetical protein